MNSADDDNEHLEPVGLRGVDQLPDLDALPDLDDEPQRPACGHTKAVAATAPVWHQLPPRTAAHEWTDLIEWVNWFVARFDLADRIPPCWAQHGPAIEEFSALKAAWTNAYLGTNTPPEAPLTWLYQTDIALERLERRWKLNCQGEHKMRREGWPTTPAANDAHDTADHDLQHRCETTPPHPDLANRSDLGAGRSAT